MQRSPIVCVMFEEQACEINSSHPHRPTGSTYTRPGPPLRAMLDEKARDGVPCSSPAQKSVTGSIIQRSTTTASTSASVAPHSSLPSTPQSPSSPHFEPATDTMWIAHLRWLMPQVHAPQYPSAAHITHDVQPLQVSCGTTYHRTCTLLC